MTFAIATAFALLTLAVARQLLIALGLMAETSRGSAPARVAVALGWVAAAAYLMAVGGLWLQVPVALAISFVGALGLFWVMGEPAPAALGERPVPESAPAAEGPRPEPPRPAERPRPEPARPAERLWMTR